MANEPAKGSHGISGGGLLGSAAAVATVVAAIVGILNQLGYIGNRDSPRTAEVSAPAFAPGVPASDEVHSAGSPASPTTLALMKPGTLNGAWRDAMGGCHLITQTGSKLDVTNYFPDSDAVMSHGDGTVDGAQIELRLMTMHGNFEVSPDGKVLSGTMFRAFAPHHSVWEYVGPSCQKSG